jgi:hypothetical protein
MTADNEKPLGDREAAAQDHGQDALAARGETPSPRSPRRATRREFFAWLARGGAAAALAAVGAVLGLRNLGRATEDPCARMDVCRSCDRADDCGLPQALLFRDAREEGRDRG